MVCVGVRNIQVVESLADNLIKNHRVIGIREYRRQIRRIEPRVHKNGNFLMSEYESGVTQEGNARRGGADRYLHCRISKVIGIAVGKVIVVLLN